MTQALPRLFLLLFLFLQVQFLGAQTPDTLSDDLPTFLVQLETWFEQEKDKELEASFASFSGLLTGGVLSEPEVRRVLRISDRMRRRRLGINPHFRSYMDFVVFLQQQPDQELLAQCQGILDTLLSPTERQPVRLAREFTQFAEQFLTSGKLRDGGSGTTWQVVGPDPRFFFAEGKPVLEFPKADILASRSGDSIRIAGASGIFFPFDGTWYGSGGTVTWERVGLDPEVYVELDSFSIDVLRSIYEVDTAYFHYPLFFGSGKVPGKFSDKVSVANEAVDASFPRFESFASRLDIDNFGEGIAYQGGFRIEGTTIYGQGTAGEKARITVSGKDNLAIFQGASERFTIRREELIVGEGVEVAFYFQGDSIYHPSASLRYRIEDKVLELSRGKQGTGRSPFFSSVHQANIDVDDIIAYPEQNRVQIGKPSIKIVNKPAVVFESLNYFNQGDFQSLKGLDLANPVVLLKRAVEKTGLRRMSTETLATQMSATYNAGNITPLLFDLAAKGFIYLYPERDLVEIKEKVFQYANAAEEKIDYDNLRIRSVTDSINGWLNLQNNEVRIQGVERLELSRRQRVAIFPDSGRLTLGKGRDFDFDGRILAGYSELQGKGFHFNYPDFKIGLDSIREWLLFVPQERPITNPETDAFALNSVLEEMEGVLLIDAESNKSGKENIPIFPSLRSEKTARVYYDSVRTGDTLFKREVFYFELDPFVFNRIDDYDRTDVHFAGVWVSSRIFPDIRETLVIRPDYSLGFLHQSPDEGYAVYQGQGRYTGAIDLSNRGVHGQGRLDYLWASIASDDLVFKPMETLGSAETFALEESREGGIEVPQVAGTNLGIRWRPYQDSLFVQSSSAPFDLFRENRHQLDGDLILTPDGVRGRGKLEWPEATLSSPFYTFGTYAARMDTASIAIRALEESGALALNTDNVNGEVNFDMQIGSFSSNEEFLETRLPYNQYMTSMNAFIWDMQGQTVTFQSDSDRLGRFTSLHPDQDSLTFQGVTGRYDLKNYLLEVGGVPFIKSADAFIYPDSGLVFVQPGGVITELTDATIVVDTINQNHRIKRATVNIKGRKDYTAQGFYEYNIAGKDQEILFSNIVGARVGKGRFSEKATATRAQGEVQDIDDFYIDKKTSFVGVISLSSENVNLNFDGFATLEAEKLPEKYPFYINCLADKDNLAIPFDTPKSNEGYPLNTGLYLSKETASVYPRVMMPLYFRKDRPILPITGVFTYDEPRDRFIFGDSSKVFRNDYRGNKLVFDNRTGEITGEGRLNLGSGLEYVSIEAVGEAKTSFLVDIPDSLRFQTPPPPVDVELMAGVRMPIPEKLLRIMANEVEASSFAATPITYLTALEKYKKQFTMLFPPSDILDESLRLMSSGILELPRKDDTYTFLFSDLKMRWDMDYQSFVTTDAAKVGLVSLGGQPVNRKLTVHAEFKMPTNEDDRLYLYFKLPSEIYYYFGYRKGILELNSNDGRFMDEALNMKKSELMIKQADGENVEIQILESGRAQMFLRRAMATGK